MEVPNYYYSSIVQDHSTPRGKLNLYITKAKSKQWILSILFIILIFVAIFVYVKDGHPDETMSLTSLSSYTVPNDYKVYFSNGKFSVFGSGDVGSSGDIPFAALLSTTDIDTLQEIEISNVLIDAPTFSRLLQGHISLESIKLHQVWISGNFLPIFLPNLTNFHLNQIRNDKTDSYKPEIKSLLFFEPSEESKWDLKKDLVNLDIKIFLSLGGTTLVDINREIGKINLNIHDCSKFLIDLDESRNPVVELTLSWCTITPSIVPKNLKYLNLNNAVPSTLELETILKSLLKLEEFYGFLPLGSNDQWNNNTNPTEVLLTSLNPLVKILSLHNIDLVIPESYDFISINSSNITTLLLENSLPSKTIELFDKIFLNLKKIAIFNFNSIESPYKFMSKILAIQPEWILIEGFNRTKDSKFEEKLYKLEIDSLLDRLKISTNSVNFILELENNTNSNEINKSTRRYTGFSLTLYERNFYRYRLLGFDKVDTYEDYVIWDN